MAFCKTESMTVNSVCALRVIYKCCRWVDIDIATGFVI